MVLLSYCTILFSVSSVQSLSCVWLFVTPWTAAHQASPPTRFWSLLKLMSIKSVLSSNHLILCHPLLYCLQSCLASGSFPKSQFFASSGQVLEFQLQYKSFQWIFTTDFFQDWVVWSPCNPRDFRSLLQQHSSKASILRASHFSILVLRTPWTVW